MVQVTVTLTFELLIPKAIGIIYGSWPCMIQRKVNLGEISLKLLSRQDFANAEQGTVGRMKCMKTEANSCFGPMDKIIICPHIKWCIEKCPGLCTMFFKTSTWYLKFMLYHAVIFDCLGIF